MSTSYVDVDDTRYFRVTDESFADAPYSVRVQVDRDLTDDEMSQLKSMIEYAYTKTGGERGNGFTQDSPKSVVYHCDTTKNRAYQRLERFFEDVESYVREGTPVRKRDGLRAIEKLDGVSSVNFYSDSVFGDVSDAAPEVVSDPGVEPSEGRDSRGFDADGVHTNGTLLDDSGVDVTGEQFNTSNAPLDPEDDRVSRTRDNDVVKFKFRGGKPVSVQKLEMLPDGKMSWGVPRTTAVGQGSQILEGVVGLNAGARAIPESVAQRYGSATESCLLCGKPLRSARSLSAGYGPECRSKLYGA